MTHRVVDVPQPLPPKLPIYDTVQDACNELDEETVDRILHINDSSFEVDRHFYRVHQRKDGTFYVLRDSKRHGTGEAQPQGLEKVFYELVPDRRIRRFEAAFNKARPAANAASNHVRPTVRIEAKTSCLPAALLCLFTPWAAAAAANAGITATNGVSAGTGSTSTLVDASVGAGLGYGMMGFSLIEVAFTTKDAADAAMARRQIELAKRKYRAGFENFRRPQEREPSAEAIVQPGSGLHSASPDGSVDAASGEQSSRPDTLKRDARDYLNYQHVTVQSEASNRSLRTTAVAFARDGVLQLAGVGNRTAGAAKLLAEGAVNVSSNAVGFVASGFSIASGALHFIQGVFEHRNASASSKVAGLVRTRMEGVSINEKVDFQKLATQADTEASKVVKYTAAKDAVSDADDITQVQELYSDFSTLFVQNNAKEEASAEVAKTRAKLRMAYGTVAAAIGVVGLALTIAGAGGPIGLAVVGVAGAVLGALWLGFAAYKVYVRRKDDRQNAELEAQQRNEAAQGIEPDLAKTEATFRASRNGYIAAALIARHLSYSKPLDTKDRPDANAVPSNAGAAQQADRKPDTDRAKERFRSKTATRFLLNAGMNRTDVRALKALAKDSTEMNNVQAAIERYLLGSSAREMMAKAS